MLRRSLVLALIALAAPAHAADRSYVVTNFDRIRVDGPFAVKVEIGTGGAAASATGDDRALGNLDISVNGATLTVRKGSQGWDEQGRTSGPPPVITVRTPAVRGAIVVGGAHLRPHQQGAWPDRGHRQAEMHHPRSIGRPDRMRCGGAALKQS
ncbi:MAG: DUF2807 domain-containing protein [Sphingomonadales bacterium]|nr:DUF2807 domain-containing protein [Sphingomonadales bacterium]